MDCISLRRKTGSPAQLAQTYNQFCGRKYLEDHSSSPKNHGSHHCDTRILRLLVPSQAAHMEADHGVAPEMSCSKLLSWTNCLVLCSAEIGLWINLLLERILDHRIIQSLDDLGHKSSGGLLLKVGLIMGSDHVAYGFIQSVLENLQE